MEYCANYTEFLRDMSIALTSAVSMLEQNRHAEPPCHVATMPHRVRCEYVCDVRNSIWRS